VTAVFPVGQLLGGFHPGPGEPAAYRRVRIGDATLPLRGPVEFGVWALAHGTGDPLGSDEYETALLEQFGPDGPGIAAELVEAGALVLVEEPAAEAMAFATRYRLRPLLCAIGPVPQPADLMTGGHGPARFGIGTAGYTMVIVDSALFGVWWWSGPAANLWSVCQRLSSPGRPPGSILDHFLRTGGGLLARGAGYLDTAVAW